MVPNCAKHYICKMFLLVTLSTFLVTGFQGLDLNISHLYDGIFLLGANRKQGQSCFSLTKIGDKIWKKETGVMLKNCWF